MDAVGSAVPAKEAAGSGSRTSPLLIVYRVVTLVVAAAVMLVSGCFARAASGESDDHVVAMVGLMRGER